MIKLLKVMDQYIFPLILFILFPLRNKRTDSKSKKVLYIRLWGIGEAVCALPTIKKLEASGYKVDILTTGRLSRTFKGLKFIQKIHLFPYRNPFWVLKLIRKLNKENYEIIIDSEQFMNVTTIASVLIKKRMSIGYNHKFRRKFYDSRIEYDENTHFVPNFAKQIEALGIVFSPKNLIPMSYDKKVKPKVDKIISEFKKKKIIAINIGSGPSAFGRRWPKEKFVILANKIVSENKDVVVVFTGAVEEAKIYDEIKEKLSGERQFSLINKLNLDEFFYFLTNTKIMISSDTGAMHMAPAMGTKTVGLFGMTDPKKSGPFPLNKNICLWKNPKGNPVINVSYGHQPSDKFSTIDLITVGDVYRAFGRLK